MEPIRDVEMVITIGSDGTLLQASHFMYDSIPVLGVNSDPTVPEERVKGSCDSAKHSYRRIAKSIIIGVVFPIFPDKFEGLLPLFRRIQRQFNSMDLFINRSIQSIHLSISIPILHDSSTEPQNPKFLLGLIYSRQEEVGEEELSHMTLLQI